MSVDEETERVQAVDIIDVGPNDTKGRALKQWTDQHPLYRIERAVLEGDAGNGADSVSILYDYPGHYVTHSSEELNIVFAKRATLLSAMLKISGYIGRIKDREEEYKERLYGNYRIDPVRLDILQDLKRTLVSLGNDGSVKADRRLNDLLDELVDSSDDDEMIKGAEKAIGMMKDITAGLGARVKAWKSKTIRL